MDPDEKIAIGRWPMKTKGTVIRAAWDSGWEEFHAGSSISENPFTLGSVSWVAWRQGWNKASATRNAPRGEPASWRPGV